MSLDLDTCIEIVQKQEEMLQFPRFNRKDVWELGNELASVVISRNLKLTVSIRHITGFVLFQYAPEGTNLNNESWMTRKFNVVREWEISSLHNKLLMAKKDQTFESKGVKAADFAASGGAFPVRIRDSELAGVVCSSGLPHLQDHDTLVECISRFLKITNVPRIPLDAGV
jgi:uncharacterized protein (UPF0303 family)